MTTDDMIDALVAEARQAPRPRPPAFLPALVLAIAAAAAVFAVVPGGFRPDIAAAAGSIRFLMKFAVTLSLAGAAFAVLREAVYPEGVGAARLRILALPAAVMLACVGFELLSLPAAEIMPSLLGRNGLGCLVDVPLIGLGPLALLILVLRRAAPARPAVAGLAAGLLAGAIAATTYATYCPDDSPLFVAFWYALAIAGLAALGAATGHLLARW